MTDDEAESLADSLNSWRGTSASSTRMRMIVDDDGHQVGAFIDVAGKVPDGCHAFWIRRNDQERYTAAEVFRLLGGGHLGRNIQLPGEVVDLLERLCDLDPRIRNASSVEVVRYALETVLNLYPVEGPPDE